MLKSHHFRAFATLLLFCSSTLLYSQTVNITGRVISAIDGTGIPSATVTVLPSGAGAVTNSSGNYTLNGVSTSAQLQVSIPGFDPTVVDVNGMSSINIYMYPSGFAYDTYYSRQSGDWNDVNTWSYVNHTGPPANDLPGATGCNVIIGSGHTVSMSSNIDVSGCGLTVDFGSTFNMNNNAIHLSGDFNINGTVANGGEIIASFCQLQINSSSATPPVFTRLTIDNIGCPVTLNTDIVFLNGVNVVNGTFDQNGFTVYPCIPPTTSPSNAVFSNYGGYSMTLSWTRGNGTGGVLVVARVSGDLQAKPQPGTAYNANAAFGSGDATGTGNYVVYKGTGTSTTINGLTPNTYYEFGVYEFNTGNCYNVSSFLGASDNSGCADPGSPTNPVNATYCSGDSPVQISVDNPGSGRNINWYTSATGGTFPPGATTSGARGEILLPASPGTYYAEIYDGTTQCASLTRTAVTLTQNSTASVSPSTLALCSGANTSAIKLSGATSFSWTVSPSANNVGASAGSGTSINQTLTNTTGTLQQVVYSITPSTNCPAQPLTVTVSVDPAITTFTTSGGGAYCQGDVGVDIALSGSQSSVQYELLLNGQSTGKTTLGTGSAISFTGITAAGTYTINARTPSNCQKLMNGQASVVVNSAPSGNGSIAGGPLSVCIGFVNTYTVNGFSQNTSSYVWTVPEGIDIVSQSNNSVTLEVTGGNGGTLSVTGQNGCGTGGSASVTLAMLAPPDVSIILPEDPYAAEPVFFDLSTSFTLTGFLWDFGDGATDQNQTPSHTYADGGTYPVQLTVSDARGCRNTVSESLIVKPPATLADGSIKNVVTANGDTKNAYLYITDINKFPDNEIVVLDRWGVEVFHAKGYNNEWDFRKDGNYLPAGNYVCIIKLSETGQTFSRTITVIKGK